MKFKNRKLYPHASNKTIFTMQIPKVICEDMGLTKDTEIEIDYVDGKFIVSKQEQTEDKQEV